MYHLRTVNFEDAEFVETEIPLSADVPACAVRLRALPGASAIHFTVANGDGVRLRGEVPADENETVLVELAIDGERLSATSPGRRVLTLAPDDRFAAPRPIVVAPPGSPLDLALVIDGTARSPSRELLLGNREAWSAHVEQLVSFVETLGSTFSDARLAVVAFGDEQPPRVKAADLLPRYRLFPSAAVHFQALGLDELRDLLLGIPPTSGADFVDAVADAFATCRNLRWRPEARKLLVLFGDSPGHSVLHPAPLGANIVPRRFDVDHEAQRLFYDLGVEIATLYLEPEIEGLREIGFKRELVDFARAQYRRLASRPAMAADAATFNPLRIIDEALGQDGQLGRAAAWSRLTEVLTKD